MYWSRKVEIPDDAIVSIGNSKFKTDKLILHERKYIWDNYDLCELAVMEHNNIISFVDEQTEELCKATVKYSLYTDTLKEELEYMRDEALEELEPDPQEGFKLKNILNELDAQRRKKLH